MDHAVAGHDGAAGCRFSAVGGELAAVGGATTASATKHRASEWILLYSSPENLNITK